MDPYRVMSLPTLSTLVTDFFVRHLAAERNVSPHTTAAYRDALKLLLRFTADHCHRTIDQLTIHDLTAAIVLEFLADLETRRHNTPRTRNARLAALQTFFRYVAAREPALASLCQPVFAIPSKKVLRPLLGYLSEQELGGKGFEKLSAQRGKGFEKLLPKGSIGFENRQSAHARQRIVPCHVDLDDVRRRTRAVADEFVDQSTRAFEQGVRSRHHGQRLTLYGDAKLPVSQCYFDGARLP
jgi:integrase family protein with SAM-like domain